MNAGWLLVVLATLQLGLARDTLIRWYLADDQGRVCHRDVFDYTTGCCDKGEQHSCQTCEESDLCCSSYAHCVSCCMGSKHEQDRRLAEVPKGLNKPETGFWTKAFDYCESVCRTTSRSTQHENAYILDRRFCFSKLGRPKQPLPPLPPLPASITAVTGQPGQSCNEVCWSVRKGCAAEHIASLNDCNALRERFPCEAGCSRTGATQAEFPGYVKPGSPKWQWPALCVVLGTAADTALQYNCSASTANVMRACTCKEVPPEELPPLPAPAAANASSAAGTGAGAAGSSAATASEGREGAAGAAGEGGAVVPQQAAAGEAQQGEGQQQQQQPQVQPQPQAGTAGEGGQHLQEPLVATLSEVAQQPQQGAEGVQLGQPQQGSQQA
ncbi:hypothetical protein N2152v2_007983 [Parachlorella kessleri]